MQAQTRISLDDQILEAEARVYDLKLQRAMAEGDSIQATQFKDLMYAKVQARRELRALMDGTATHALA